jgi:hypothetical protein
LADAGTRRRVGLSNSIRTPNTRSTRDKRGGSVSANQDGPDQFIKGDNMKKILVFLAVSLALVTAATAAFIEEGDTGGAQRAPQVWHPPSFPPDICNAADAVRSMVRNVEIGDPSRRMGVEVYPVRQKSWPGDSGIRSLSDALSDRDLEVREQGGGSVPWVSVRNDSRRPVLLVAGEILSGGKQNRIVAADFLVPPHSDWTDVSVFCGERSRWSDGSAFFKSSGGFAPAQMRDQLARGTNQSEVWSEAKKTLDETGAQNRTEDLSDVYSKGKIAETLRCFHNHHWVDFPRDTIGMVVTSGPRVLGVEIFPNTGVFRDNWRSVLNSYLAHYGPVRTFCGKESADIYYPNSRKEIAEDALRALADAGFDGGAIAGMGCGVRVRSPGLSGQVLTSGGVLIHAGAVGGPSIIPVMPKGGVE